MERYKKERPHRKFACFISFFNSSPPREDTLVPAPTTLPGTSQLGVRIDICLFEFYKSIMTIYKFKFGIKKKALELADDYFVEGDYEQDGSYIRRASFLPQHPVQTPPDSLGDEEQHQDLENELEEKLNFPVKTMPWKKHKLFSSPFPRYRHSASSVASENNEIYVMGGLKDGSVYGDIWKITPQVSPSGTSIDGFVALHIEVIQNNPPARVGHSSILCGNAYIIFGGDTVDTEHHGFPDDNLYMLNIDNCKYTVPLHILNKPKGRYGHLIGVVRMNSTCYRLYLFGGQFENDIYNDMYYFELNSFKLPKARWELVEPVDSSMPPPLTNHTMCIHKYKIYVFGGIYDNEIVSNDLWCFDTLVSKWLQVKTSGDIPAPVNEHAACVASDVLYVYGGNDFSGTIYDTLYALDLESSTWTKLCKELDKDGPGARCGHTMSFIPKLNKLVIMGGDKNDYMHSGEFDYDAYEDGQDAGAIIYELDLTTANHFMKAGHPSKTAISVGRGADLASGRAPSPLPSEDAFVSHRRCISGYEEYKAPKGSSDQLSRFLDPNGEEKMHKYNNGYGDRFVDVPSSAISIKMALGEHSEDEGLRSALRSKANWLSAMCGDITESNIESDKFHNDDTPILTKDFAYASDEYETDALISQRSKKSKAAQARKAISPFADVPFDTTSAPTAEVSEMQAVINKLTKQVSQLEAQKAAERDRNEADLDALKLELADLKIKAIERKTAYELDLQAQNELLEERSSLLFELKNTLGPEFFEREGIEPVATGITELTRFKILYLEMLNKLTHVILENVDLKQKWARFEPFMNNQIEELSSFQKVIKAQEDRITFLTSQVKLRLALLEQIATLKHEKEDLQLQFSNYKVINAPLEIGGRNGEDRDGNYPTILSAKLTDLISLWQASTRIDAISAEEKESAIVALLQTQVEELLKTARVQQELSSVEVQELKKELQTATASLKMFENNYRDAIHAAQRTEEALDLTKDELQNKKNTLENLAKQDGGLRLFHRTSGSGSIVSDQNVDEEDKDNLSAVATKSSVAAHYNMKLEEMQAKLFVTKNENELLTATVTSLQKELYLAKNQD